MFSSFVTTTGNLGLIHSTQEKQNIKKNHHRIFKRIHSKYTNSQLKQLGVILHFTSNFTGFRKEQIHNIIRMLQRQKRRTLRPCGLGMSKPCYHICPSNGSTNGQQSEELNWIQEPFHYHNATFISLFVRLFLLSS